MIVDRIRAHVALMAEVERDREVRGDWFLCPAHPDRRPSAHIFDEGRKWKCHSCGVYGDVIDFVAHRDQLTTRAAIAQLASEHGLGGRPSRQEKTRRQEKNRDLERIDRATHEVKARLRYWDNEQLWCRMMMRHMEPDETPALYGRYVDELFTAERRSQEAEDALADLGRVRRMYVAGRGRAHADRNARVRSVVTALLEV